MRIKNKEINRRRHRKEQKIKDADRDLRAKYGEKKSTAPAPGTKTKAAPKAATKKAEAVAPIAASKTTEVVAPKAAPKKTDATAPKAAPKKTDAAAPKAAVKKPVETEAAKPKKEAKAAKASE